MATVNFSVPEDVKEAFNRTFRGENKSAILTRLMKEAVENRERALRRKAAVEAILAARNEGESFSDRDIRGARTAGRP